MPDIRVEILTTDPPIAATLRADTLRLTDGARARVVTASELGGEAPRALLRSGSWLGVLTQRGVWRCALADFAAAPLEQVAALERLSDEALRARLGPGEGLEDPPPGAALLVAAGGARLAAPDAPWFALVHRADAIELGHLDAPAERRLLHVPGFALPEGALDLRLDARLSPPTLVVSTPEPRRSDKEPGGAYLCDLSAEAPRFERLDSPVDEHVVAARGPWIATFHGARHLSGHAPALRRARFFRAPDKTPRVALDLDGVDPPAGLEGLTDDAHHLRPGRFSRDGQAMVIEVGSGAAYLVVDLDAEALVEVVRPEGRAVSVDADGATVSVDLEAAVAVIGRHGVASLPAPLTDTRALGDGEHWLTLEPAGLTLRALSSREPLRRWPERAALPLAAGFSAEARRLLLVDQDSETLIDLGAAVERAPSAPLLDDRVAAFAATSTRATGSGRAMSRPPDAAPPPRAEPDPTGAEPDAAAPVSLAFDERRVRQRGERLLRELVAEGVLILARGVRPEALTDLALALLRDDAPPDDRVWAFLDALDEDWRVRFHMLHSQLLHQRLAQTR